MKRLRPMYPGPLQRSIIYHVSQNGRKAISVVM